MAKKGVAKRARKRSDEKLEFGRLLSEGKAARRASLLPFQAVLESIAEKLTFADAAVRRTGLDGEGTDGLYGSLTFAAQLKLTWALMARGELPPGPGHWEPGREPVVVDFGAGTGRPLFLWQALNLVHHGIGYELESLKVYKAAVYLAKMAFAARFGAARLPVRTDPPTVVARDLTELPPEEVAVHRPTIGYSFCAGIPEAARRAVGDIFRGCPTMKVLLLVDYGRCAVSEALGKLVHREGRGEEPELIFTHSTLSDLTQMGGGGTYRAIFVNKREERKGEGEGDSETRSA